MHLTQLKVSDNYKEMWGTGGWEDTEYKYIPILFYWKL